MPHSARRKFYLLVMALLPPLLCGCHETSGTTSGGAHTVSGAMVVRATKSPFADFRMDRSCAADDQEYQGISCGDMALGVSGQRARGSLDPRLVVWSEVRTDYPEISRRLQVLGMKFPSTAMNWRAPTLDFVNDSGIFRLDTISGELTGDIDGLIEEYTLRLGAPTMDGTTAGWRKAGTTLTVQRVEPHTALIVFQHQALKSMRTKKLALTGEIR